MRWISAAALIAATGILSVQQVPAQALTYPWCSNTSGVGKDCYHPNFSQCMHDVTGIGGFCYPNTGYNPDSSGANNFTPDAGITLPPQ